MPDLSIAEVLVDASGYFGKEEFYRWSATYLSKQGYGWAQSVGALRKAGLEVDAIGYARATGEIFGRADADRYFGRVGWESVGVEGRMLVTQWSYPSEYRYLVQRQGLDLYGNPYKDDPYFVYSDELLSARDVTERERDKIAAGGTVSGATEYRGEYWYTVLRGEQLGEERVF